MLNVGTSSPLYVINVCGNRTVSPAILIYILQKENVHDFLDDSKM